MSTVFETRRTRLAGTAVVVLVAIAACGDATSETGVVDTRDVEGVGTVLTDADGNTLYTTDAEDDGTVRCVDACADVWPPVEADADVPTDMDDVDGTFASVTRPDGVVQLTLDDHPLYTFRDDSPGSAAGDGIEDDFQGTHFAWRAVTTDPDTDEGTDDDTDDRGPGGYGY